MQRTRYTSLNWMNGLGVLAFALALGRTIGLAWPEPLPWMAEAGEFVYDASLAFLVGFVLHLLVVA